MIGYKINDFWLVLTSTSSIFALLICLFSTWLSIYLKQIDYSFSKSTDVPISHCFKSNTTDFGFFYYENETVQGKANFLYICYENHCKPLVRICDKNETETDIINWICLGLTICSLISILLSSYCLQRLGDYESMFNASKCLMHSSYLNDCVALEFKKQLEQGKQTNVTNRTVHDLIANASKSCLRKHDPVTGDTCLHVAFQKCFFKEVKQMIKKGGNPFQMNNNDESIASLCELSHMDKIKELIEKNGEDVFCRTVISLDKIEFWCKITIEQTSFGGVEGKFVIQDHKGNRQITKDFSNPYGIVLAICLMKEACERIEKTVKFQKSAEIKNTRKMFKNLANFIFKCENIESLRTLYDGAFHPENVKVRSVNWRCTSILQKILPSNNIQTYQILKFLGASQEAKNENKENVFHSLLKEMDKYGTTKFFWHALKNGACCFELDENHKRVILDLIREKCFEGKEKIPPNMEQIFFYAAANCDDDSVEIFLDKGMDPNVCDKIKHTAVHFATISGNFKNLEVLLKNGADVHVQDLHMKYPIHYAMDFKTLKVLLIYGANIDVKTQDKKTLLHIIVKRGDLEYMKYILKKEANINAEDKLQQTPLHIAAMHNHCECLKFLVDDGARINVPDFNKQTPLHHAAINGCSDCIQCLLERNAQPLATDENGKKPVDLCEDAECIKVFSDFFPFRLS